MIASLRRLLTGLGSARRAGQGTHVVDLSRPEVVRDPYPHYAALQRSGSVHFLPAHGFWLVLGYEDVAYALKNPQLFSSARTPARFDPVLNEVDPPAQTRVRRILAPYFSAQAVQRLEEHTGACARELLEDGGEAPEFELVSRFSMPLTERVVGRLLGLTGDETASLRGRLDSHAHRLDGDAFRALEDWFREHLQEQRDAPGESMGIQLLRGGMGEEEVVGLMKLLWVAGTTTTSRLISNAVLLLLKHPQARTELQADPRLVPLFVEEALRLDAPEQMLWRIAREDAELAGARIPAGAEVRLCLAAANRDPKHFAEPDSLSLHRAPNDHLSFGVGPHFCPGTRLARLQGRVAIETLLAAWPDFRAARPLSTVSFGESFYYRGLSHLFVAAK